MGSRRMKHLNELRVKAMAGDKIAAAQLNAELWVPHHNRRSDGPLAALHRRIGTTFKQGVHVTAKTLQAVRCSVSTTVSPDYGLDRLQMLKDRRERREARGAAA